MHGAHSSRPDPEDPDGRSGTTPRPRPLLAFDLRTLLQRRQALRYLAGAGAVVLVGCGTNRGGLLLGPLAPHPLEVYPSLADGYDQQLAATTGDATRGYEASLTVPV